MNDYKLLRKNSPLVFAAKKNDCIATVHSSLPAIYYKNFDINEFIGEQLASIRELKSNHYFPVSFSRDARNNLDNYSFCRSNIKVGSFDFMKKGREYYTATQLPFYFDKLPFEELLELCLDDQNRVELINENLEMMALDIYMSQWDRGGNTYYEFFPNGEIHLAPIFDYEASMEKLDAGDIEYTSDFFQFMTIDDYHEMMVKYPQFREMLQSYLNTDLESQLRSMCRSRQFNFSSIDIDSYRRYDEVSHKKLEKILK